MEENYNSLGVKKRSFFDKISFSILLLITFLAPIFFVPVAFISTQFGTSLLFAFGVILALLVYIISTLFYGELDLPTPSKYILGSIALVPTVYTLAGIANGFSRMSFFGYTFDINTVGFMLLGFVYLFMVSLLFRNKVRIFYSYFIFVISAIILSLFLLVRIIFGPEVLSFGIFGSLTSSMIGSWNNVGIFFGVGVILSLLTYEMIRVSRLMKVLLIVALTFSLLFLALVNFDVIWIIIATTSFLFIVYSLFNSQEVVSEPTSIKQKLLRIPLCTTLVFIISVVFVIWGTFLGSFLSNTLKVTNVEIRPTLAVTLDIARKTIIDRPLFGSGPNTFTTQWLTWKPDDIVSTVFWNTDFANGIGLLPTFAVTTGILGILSWLLFLGFYVYLGVKSIFIRIEDSFMKYLLTSSFFISLYLWFMTFMYMPSTAIFILTLFFTGLFFASVYMTGIIKIETKTFSLNPRAGFISFLVLVGFFLASITLGYGLFKNSISLWYFQKSSYALNTTGDVSLSEQYMAKAISAVPNDVYYRALSEIEIIKLNQILSQDPKTVKPEDAQKQFNDTLTSAIKAGIAAKDADSTNYLNWIALGRVYEAASIPELKIEGAYESAQFAYNEALRHNPKNPGILILFSRLAIIRKDLAQARSYALQAIQLKRNYIDAYFLLSQIEVEDKNIQGAIESVTAASVIDPTNSGVFFQLGLLKYNSENFNGAVEALSKAIEITPNYANAKYFLGLSYEKIGKHAKAIAEFEALKITNPDSKEVETILTDLKAGKSLFADTTTAGPEKSTKLPVKESQ
ncbi:MAG: tetratricopeptide repeat protein [Candidatus Zambryskibacteria bacterium]|nr:tetratricopeptide repeat protein [Candidatus Zambryskibacteria bacterium]